VINGLSDVHVVATSSAVKRNEGIAGATTMVGDIKLLIGCCATRSHSASGPAERVLGTDLLRFETEREAEK
jgi:hypothetical protein